MWVALEADQAVVEVDLRLRRSIATYPVDGNPHNLTIAPDGTVAATLPDAGQLALINSRSVRHVKLDGSPHDVKATLDMFLVANEGTQRLHLLTLRGERVAEIPLPAQPHDLAISADRRRAWVSLDGSSRIAVIDIRRRKVSRFISTNGRPHDLLFAPDGSVWVSDWSTGVWVYSSDGKLIARVLGGFEIHHLAFTPDGRTAWLTSHAGDRVFVLATETHEVLSSIALSGAPHHVAATPDGRWVAVANHDGGSVDVFDARSRRLISQIEIGAGPHGVWAVPEPAA